MSSTSAARDPEISPVLRLALVPARLLGRFKAELAASADLDEARFAGSRIYPVLAVTAVAYPIVASIAHALGSATFGVADLSFAIRPTFDVVYAESLTFILAGIGLALISPALGALFMAVFVPADLVAAYYSGEIQNTGIQVPFTGLLGRLASLGLLWIAVVELPIRARDALVGWAARHDRDPTTLSLAIGYALIASLLVFIWSTSIGFFVQVAYTWGPLQVPSNLASDPTWYYWPLLVVGTAIAAIIGVVLPRPLAGGLGYLQLEEPASRPTLAGTIGRQVIASLVLAVLAGALITGVAEGLVVIGGLLLAGPGLTLALRGIPTPRSLANVPSSLRWVLAIAVAAGLSFVLMTFFWDALDISSNLGFALTGVIVAVAFRIVLSLGDPAPWQDSPSPAQTPVAA